MGTYSQLIKQAGLFDWFKSAPKNSMPASHYDNRMTQHQVNNQNLGKNSIPASHYANRQTEQTTRGQMGLAPGSYKAYQQAQDRLSKTWEPMDRKSLMVQALDANTPGFHQYGYNDDGSFDSAFESSRPSNQPFDHRNNGYKDNPAGYGIRFNSYQEQPSSPSRQQIWRSTRGYPAVKQPLPLPLPEDAQRAAFMDAKYNEIYGGMPSKGFGGYSF